MSENASCQHFTAYVKEFGLETFSVVHAFFSACVSEEARRRKALSCLCYTCGSSGPQLYSCLHCIYFGCKGAHILSHLKSNKHTIALELSYGMIYCNSCKDFIYDQQCRKIADKHLRKEAICLNKSLTWRPWIPSQAEIYSLLQHPRRRHVTPGASVGLRGLFNIGNTCFMNCIVQALIHTPLLRDYFLSESHECIINSSIKCLACQVSRLFQEFYSGSRSPLSLHQFLYLIWNHVTPLDGHKQQDAHEFFIATLDVIHRHCTENDKHLLTNNSERCLSDCDCIIDKIFSGALQSDVVCQSCQGISTTIDPIWDISLDLGGTTKHCTGPPKSLVNCLEHFTRVEHLGVIKCSNCKSEQESTKELSMRTLPIIASFHLKRFEHSSVINLNEKISSFISFPAELDMSPFMSKKHDNRHDFTDYRYSLYAVINHIGTFDGGHYIAYVRHQKDKWFKCDDRVITAASLRQVLDSEGYLLFYHKKILEYE